MSLPKVGAEITLDSKVLRVDGYLKNTRGESNVRWAGPGDMAGICMPSFWDLKAKVAQEQEEGQKKKRNRQAGSGGIS